MVITVDKEMLLKSINIADSIISSKNINTILANCLFNISVNEIEILSTDNEIAIRTRLDAISDSDGVFAVNGKKFSQILKELPNDELQLIINKSYMLDVKSKAKDIKGHYSLIGQSGQEYPEIPAFDNNNVIELEQSIFKEMFKKVIHAASSDVIKPVFNGVFIIMDQEGKVTIVATDSRRLSIITRKIENKIDLGEGIIIPLKTVNEFLRLLENSGRCRFSYNNNQCFLKLSNSEVISRIVDGHFPNYKQVIPKTQTIEAIIETKKFIDSLRRAMIFTREPAHKIVLHFSKDKLVIEANTPELGECEEELPIESNSNEKISLGINCQFLLDTLKEIDSFSVKCGMSGHMSPVTIMPEDDSDYISVIMPIQIKSSQSD